MVKIGDSGGVQVLGLKELDKKLRELSKSTNKNLLAPALRKAANVIKDQAIRNAPVDPTPDGVHIKNDIKVRRDPNPKLKGQNEIMYVKPFSKKAKREDSTYYWRFVELGTVNQTGNRFLTRAYNSKKKEAVKEFIESLTKSIIRETKRLKK